MPQRPARPDTKAAIRDAARRLFTRFGYAGVSVRDIAAEVGIRPSAIYNHFASKHEILVDLMEGHMERILRDAAAALDGIADPAARLEAFARFHVLRHMEAPEDVFLAYMELRSLDAEARARIVAERDRYEALLHDILHAGAASGLFRIGDAAVLARALLAMLTGVTTWYRDGGRLDRDAVAGTYVAAVRGAVGLG
ncbi:TetR family transcriptional regulator [Roseivivax sp. CAU 1761]